MIFLIFFRPKYLTFPKLYKCEEKIEISQSTAKLKICTKIAKFACTHSMLIISRMDADIYFFSSHLKLGRVYLNIYEKKIKFLSLITKWY